MATGTLKQVWDSIADRGREILDVRLDDRQEQDLETLCRVLLSEKGEAAGTAIARELVGRYAHLKDSEKLAFLTLLGRRFSPDVQEVIQAADAYRQHPDAETLLALNRAAEPPRQELLRRMNMAPNGTAAIVGMRADLLRFLSKNPELHAVDADFQHLLRSWFNRGFLVLQSIDWGTPADILEKLSQHEAVHEIQSWQDMRRRLAKDRCCFAFFHPALSNEPLIFVEVALLNQIPTTIQPLLDAEVPPQGAEEATTAVFYSISNCQPGLRGISFGSFLIKQVIAELVADVPTLKTFVTLSPVPRFRSWLDEIIDAEDVNGLSRKERNALMQLKQANWYKDAALTQRLRPVLLKLCVRYLISEKKDGEPVDPVARFHLGNGARVEQVNWLGDTSKKGMRQSAGIMVNYAYRLKEIEKNHEAYTHNGKVAASAKVRGLLK